eukprot:scaffold248175_cov14-Prasinocladus_malaysianus.AAC.1
MSCHISSQFLLVSSYLSLVSYHLVSSRLGSARLGSVSHRLISIPSVSSRPVSSCLNHFFVLWPFISIYLVLSHIIPSRLSLVSSFLNLVSLRLLSSCQFRLVSSRDMSCGLVSARLNIVSSQSLLVSSPLLISISLVSSRR